MRISHKAILYVMCAGLFLSTCYYAVEAKSREEFNSMMLRRAEELKMTLRHNSIVRAGDRTGTKDVAVRFDPTAGEYSAEFPKGAVVSHCLWGFSSDKGLVNSRETVGSHVIGRSSLWPGVDYGSHVNLVLTCLDDGGMAIYNGSYADKDLAKK